MSPRGLSAIDRQKRQADLMRRVRYAARLALQVAVFIALASLFFLRAPQVEGRSMLPGVQSGDHVLINTLAYGIALGPWVVARTSVRRGDIIAFERGQGDDTKTFLKRVIALPGEHVEIRDGIVWVAGDPLVTPATILPDSSTMKALVVPSAMVFVLGDNRAESDDSRTFGPVAQSSIIGKALFVIWPIMHVKRIR